MRLISPLPLGSASDIAARMLAERLSERWRQPVIVENRPGADGIPAVGGFAAARDNHTLLFSFAGPVTINPLIYEKLPYDPARDLVPIASMMDNFIGIAASDKLNVNSLEDFVQLARSQPGKLNWAGTPGPPIYIFAALQRSMAVDMVQVAYRDFTPALQDFAEGRIHAVVTGLGLLLQQVQAGKAKLLMVTNRTRSPQAPDVPTASEAGHPELTFQGIVGFYGWRDMPSKLKERIAADVHAAASDPTIGARVASMGSALYLTTPTEFAAAIEQQRDFVAAIVRAWKPSQ